jgi:hypothetical protein
MTGEWPSWRSRRPVRKPSAMLAVRRRSRNRRQARGSPAFRCGAVPAVHRAPATISKMKRVHATRSPLSPVAPRRPMASAQLATTTASKETAANVGGPALGPTEEARFLVAICGRTAYFWKGEEGPLGEVRIGQRHRSEGVLD